MKQTINLAKEAGCNSAYQSCLPQTSSDSGGSGGYIGGCGIDRSCPDSECGVIKSCE